MHWTQTFYNSFNFLTTKMVYTSWKMATRRATSRRSSEEAGSTSEDVDFLHMNSLLPKCLPLSYAVHIS
jgi:hypothetical protein